jgi:SpoVK/Ycf46/Vps4 family AAA+-type ATPase
MQKNQYFKKIFQNLKNSEKRTSGRSDRLDFADLKILEYWVRIIRESPESLNKEIAIRLVNEPYRSAIVDGFIETLGGYIKPKRAAVKKKKQSVEFNNCRDCDAIDDDFLDDIFDEDGSLNESDEVEMDTEFCDSRFLRQICRYRKEIKLGASDQVTENLLKTIADVEPSSMAPFLYKRVQGVICENFEKYALEMLSRGVSERDRVYKRVQKVKETYRLNDAETEMLVYMWLHNREELQIDSDGEFFGRRRRHFGSPNITQSMLRELARATGLEQDYVSSLLGQNGTLRMLNLCDDDLDIPPEVQSYLNGYGDSTGLKAFRLAEPGTVPFAQLQGNNPDALLALDMIKNHDRKHPLNILFYGIEGSGKTELAKAIAKEAGLPLWEVSIDADNADPGRRMESRAQSLMYYRIRAAMLANWQCEQEPGIIMIDEADLVLNGFEKGSLNHFFEQMRTPIIWITNSLHFTEGSTRRRFDFSIAFKGLSKDERLNMLNSVLKSQSAETMLTPEEKLKLVVEYPAMAGGFTLAAQHTRELLASGIATQAYPTMARILKAHTKLLGIQNGTLRDVECHAPSYSLTGLNIEGSVDEIMEVVQAYDTVWKRLDEDSAPNSLNILLYGPPGTGKTEFVRHLARTLGRNLIVRKASDLLGMFVGQTEAQIAAAFEEAERTKSILFFDEADSFLRDRSGAMQGHEVSKVNEILTRMENFKGIFIAATNFNDSLDSASRRRFALKLGFGYLKPEGVRHLWNVFFPSVQCPDSVTELPMLTPGDFNAVNGRLRYLPESVRSASRIEAELHKELQAKDAHAGRTMGF